MTSPSGRSSSRPCPVRQGTFFKILMTGQAELAQTLDSLRGDSAGAVSDLTDMLRRTVLETGGIPVSGFRALLSEKVRQAFLRWDRQKEGPEGGRGIEHPWQKEKGTVLEAWYARESLRARRAEALSYEESLDEVNGSLRQVALSTAKAEAFLSENRKAARDAVERRRLEAERAAVGLELEKLYKANGEWPVVTARVEEIRRALEALEAARAPLEEEGRVARAVEESRALRERHARVARLVSRVEAERARAKAAPRMERRDLEAIRKAAAEAAALRAALDACTLTVSISGRKDIELVVQEDLAAESTTQISVGKTARLRAAGRLWISHPDMDIEVRSGDPGALSASQKEAEARKALAALLERHRAASVDEAEERARVSEETAAAVRAAEKSLADELGGQSAADLEARVAALGPARESRPWAEVSAELARLAPERDARMREAAELQKKLAEWQAAWGTPNALVDALAEARRREKEIVQGIEGSAALPAGFADPASFLSAYEKARDDLKSLGDERARLSDRKRDLEKSAPEQSAEELEGLVKDAEGAFDAALSRARALERIRDVSDSLLGESDSAVFAGMKAELDPLVASMSLGRHARADMDGSLPRGLADAHGRSLPWELLSGGTRDMLALALRLAMASFFLRRTDGFLMLDDPLVEMDPDRQSAAAAALSAFAETRQLIVFTCHPSTAELLRGTLITL